MRWLGHSQRGLNHVSGGSALHSALFLDIISSGRFWQKGTTSYNHSTWLNCSERTASFLWLQCRARDISNYAKEYLPYVQIHTSNHPSLNSHPLAQLRGPFPSINHPFKPHRHALASRSSFHRKLKIRRPDSNSVQCESESLFSQ